MKSVLAFALVLLATLIFGYPIAAAFEHGLTTSLWLGPSLDDWEWKLSNFQVADILGTYIAMLSDRSAAFAGGGLYQVSFILAPCFAMLLLMVSRRQSIDRAADGIYGTARFATPSDLARLRRGLELGRDPNTGWAVRVDVQRTLITFAPPRSGKTSGLLIPNLAYPEVGAWNGPAVVLDTKGEVYRAVADRRRAMGRRVVCLDPVGLVAGKDKWNPLEGLDPADILYLQQTARALLPSAESETNGAYFTNRAIDYLTGVFLAALNGENASPRSVVDLINDPDRLGKALRALGNVTAARNALQILDAEARVRDPIQSTAAQAFAWLSDERLQRLVYRSTFNLMDIASGGTDLFITYPSDSAKTLAPFLRWFLNDLFAVARKKRLVERIVVFVDEAANLGRFDEILSAASELPGRGLSLWTFWQDREQIVNLYGQSQARTLLNLAEIVTISDLAQVDPDEIDRWSRALGDFTAIMESKTTSADGSKSTSQSSQSVRLMTNDALSRMKANELLVFSNDSSRSKCPMILHKTVSHRDPRFKRFLQSVEPVGRT